ncbi:helix-turn-helix domain-containing protein, partial [Salmonella enterica]|uniref:helix-turn-helix domain-containing protein n=1 Tax=Salmonella enterica TaxID=28901 RepID=UPI0020CB19F9
SNSTIFIFQKLSKNVLFAQEEPCCSGIEMERELIVERTLAGLAAARARGRTGGRRPKLTKEQHEQIARLIKNGHDRKQLAIIYGIGISTIYRYHPAGESSGTIEKSQETK